MLGLARVGQIRAANTVYGYPNCRLWLDADDSTTLTLVGSNVTVWKDKSESATYMKVGQSGAVSNTSPTYSSTDKSVRFSNSTSSISAASQGLQANTNITLSPGSNRSVYVVFKMPTTDTTGLHAALRMASNVSFFAYHLTINGTKEITDLAVSTSYTTTFTTGNMYLSSYTISPTTGGSLYTNGALSASNTTTFTGISTSQTLTQVSVGAGYDHRAWNGYLYELLYYNAHHDTTTRRAIEGHLVSKWSVTGYT